MLETTRRFSLHDFVLVLLSTVTLAYFLSSQRVPRQWVQINQTEATPARLALTVGSPAWREVKLAHQRWLDGESFEKENAVNRWKQELAAHYVDQAQSKISQQLGDVSNQSAVRLASAVYPADASVGNLTTAVNRREALNASLAKWLEFGKSARYKQLQQQDLMRERQSGIAGAPVVFGEVFAEQDSRAFLRSLTFGLLVGLVYILSCFIWPTRRFRDQFLSSNDLLDDTQAIALVGGPLMLDGSSEATHADLSPTREFHVDLPAHWIGIRQSFVVQIRSFMVPVLVALALLSVCI